MPECKKILVTGRDGQLGCCLQNLVKENPHFQFTFTSRKELDLAREDSINAFFSQNRFDIIINCAAYTAVDRAEEEEDQADKINHLAVKHLAAISRQQQSLLIHISTDYVFDGAACIPYQEDDVINPQNIYGLTKLKAEQSISAIATHAVIVRSSWIYSEYGQNFVKTMLKLGREKEQLAVVFDQIGSPTYAHDLATALIKIVERESEKKPDIEHPLVNVYHYSNEGVCSWYDFAQAIFQLSDISCHLEPQETKDFPRPAKRPHYSVLNKAKIKQQYQLHIPHWRESLQTCLKQLNKEIL